MKNIFKFIPWVLIGRIIGIIVIIPLGYNMYDKIFYKNKYNEDAELYYTIYIKQTKEITVIMPAFGSKLYLDHDLDEEVKTVEIFPRSSKADAFSSLTGYYIPFYSTKYEKYFNVMYFDYVCQYEFDEEVYLTVNKDDMQNPQYGTKENPIPVLKMVGVKESIRPNNKDFDTTYMNEFYKNNVIRYLKYKMSQKEFNQRFKRHTYEK